MATAEKGTKENPYTMEEYEALLDAGTWQGGFVRDDAGSVVYTMKEVTVNGYSGYSGYGSSGSGFGSLGSGWWGSDPMNGGNTDGDNTDEGGHHSGGNSTGGGGTNTSGGGGGHNTNNSQTAEFNVDKSKYDTLYENINYTKIISGGIRKAINALGNAGRIKVNSLIIDGVEQNHAQYSEEDHIFYVASDSGIESFIHELVHYYQDENHILNYVKSASNNEFQAEFLEQMISIARGYETNLNAYNYEKFGFSYEEFVEFCNYIRENSKNNGGEVELKGYNIDNYLNNISTSKWNERMDTFINYYRDRYPGNQYESHKKDKNPNYQWSWSQIINKMEFERY